MTSAEKKRIIWLREKGYGYAQIANRMGLPKSTISTFCKRNGLSEDNKEAGKPYNCLLSGERRVNTVTDLPQSTTVVEGDEDLDFPCEVTVTYADKPDPTAVADVISILKNAERSQKQ